MAEKISPKNISAQLSYEAKGNPPGAHPRSAVGNFFPGLEFNFLNLWKRVFIGIELCESSGLVLDVDKNADLNIKRLKGMNLIAVNAKVQAGKIVDMGRSLIVPIIGPTEQDTANEDQTLGTAFLEWGNALADIHFEFGGTQKLVTCLFHTLRQDDKSDPTPVDLKVRKLLDPDSAAISKDGNLPGELTESLCSPWQTDFVGCACYYWAANRPDYINVWQDGEKSGGHNWLNWTEKGQSRDGKPFYTLEPEKLLRHESIMKDWEKKLRFVIGGKEES